MTLKEALELFEAVKELKVIIKRQKAAGWKIDDSRKHYVFVPPHGIGQVISSKTPSDIRSVKNLESQLKRYETPEGAKAALNMSLKRDPDAPVKQKNR